MQWLRPTSVALLCLTFRLQRCIVLHVRSVDARYNVCHASLDSSSEVRTSVATLELDAGVFCHLARVSLIETYSSRVQSTISCVYMRVWNRPHMPHTPPGPLQLLGVTKWLGFGIFRCGSLVVKYG